jgi:hypothetical protein
MSSGVVELRHPASMTRAGQATLVEQSRAVAEVHAQVVVAQQMPRDIDRAVAEMQRSCARKGMADKAFYRYRRGGSQVSGETVVLAKELARCWGNIDYGLAELRRDDIAGESEMMAFAWDLQTNTRPRTTFIVPHVRDRSAENGGAVRLTETRDVYELNANMGARRMREMIFNILPPWFIEDAKTLCYATLAADTSDGATLAERAATAVAKYGRIGVRPEQLTQKVGAPQAHWSAADLATLSVIFRSIERRETTAEEEFGATAARITASDLAPPTDVPPAVPDAAPSSGPAAAPPSAEVAAAGGTRPPQRASTGQVGMIRKKFAELYPGEESPADREQRLEQTAQLAGRPNFGPGSLGSTKDLTSDEATRVLDALKRVGSAKALEVLLGSGEVNSGG